MAYTLRPNQEQNFDFELARKITEDHGLVYYFRDYNMDGGIFILDTKSRYNRTKADEKQIADCLKALNDAGYPSTSNAYVGYYRKNFVIVPYRETVKAMKMKEQIIKNQIRGMIRRLETFQTKTKSTIQNTGVDFSAEMGQLDTLMSGLKGRLENL